jgi:hypothetical protein
MKILIPTSINDISLEQYQRFAKINTDDQDEEFFIFKTIEIFCGIDMSVVSKFPIKDAKEISEEIVNVLNQNAEFKDRFEMNGVKYGFIPELQKMSLGEYIDLEESLKGVDSFHKAAAVMYRPITKEFKELYDVQGYDASNERQLDMKEAPLGIISAAIVFFYNIANELLLASQHYSKSEMEKISTTLERVSLARNTAGLTAYTHYLEVIRQNMDLLQS